MFIKFKNHFWETQRHWWHFDILFRAYAEAIIQGLLALSGIGIGIGKRKRRILITESTAQKRGLNDAKVVAFGASKVYLRKKLAN